MHYSNYILIVCACVFLPTANFVVTHRRMCTKLTTNVSTKFIRTRLPLCTNNSSKTKPLSLIRICIPSVSLYSTVRFLLVCVIHKTFKNSHHIKLGSPRSRNKHCRLHVPTAQENSASSSFVSANDLAHTTLRLCQYPIMAAC